jgi:putative spermidine/putrescine transport system ATP-binding protein
MARGAVSLREVSKSFGAVAAVRGVSLEVAAGEFLTLLGPSGCGKTTLLRMIAGLESPDRGRLFLSGRDVTSDPPHRRPVNTVFQDYALFPHLNVLDNVAFSLMLRKVPRKERYSQAEAALEMVRLAGHGTRRPSQLSGGQRQRVALARAIVNKPKVLLLDEPLGALDLKLRESMQDELKALQKTLGITFIFVTHDQGEALSMADRVAVFNEGRVQQIGTPEDVYRRPVSRFVADFVGSSNVLQPEFVYWVTGEKRWASLRPEAIHVMAAGASASRMTGTIVSRSYLGPVIRLLIDLNGTKLHAAVPSGEAVPGEGARVTLGFAKDAIHMMEPAE